jgi:hypothetical protein
VLLAVAGLTIMAIVGERIGHALPAGDPLDPTFSGSFALFSWLAPTAAFAVEVKDLGGGSKGHYLGSLSPMERGKRAVPGDASQSPRC